MARAAAIAEIEELPEADRLEGFPHPRETKELFGHAAAERTLAEALSERAHAPRLAARRAARASARRRSPTASRVPRSPRRTSATRAARASRSADDTSAARQVRALSHPGLLVLRRPYDEKAKRFATSIPIDEVRRLRSFLSHRAADGRLARRHRRRGQRAQRQRRQRASEVAGGAADAHGVPARVVGAGASAADHPLALPHARPAAARRARPCAPPRRRRSRPPATTAPERRRTGRRSSASPRAASGRLLGLRARAGSSSASALSKLLAGLPRVDWRAVHALSDELQPIAAQARFELFFELLLDALSAPHPRPGQRARGQPRTGNWPPASSARRGLPRLPPCGKELAAKRPRRWRSTSIARHSFSRPWPASPPPPRIASPPSRCTCMRRLRQRHARSARM